MPADKVNSQGEIEEAKGLRGKNSATREKGYLKERITKPRRNARRAAAINAGTELEQRAANVDGSILERIVFKRLTTIWGKPGVDFIYKYQLGAVEGVKDARAFLGGVEMDFVILNRPSGKELALEVHGEHWHGPKDAFDDIERALIVLGTGRDYAEVWEHEIMVGDDFLDAKLLEVIGPPTARVAQRNQERTIRRFTRDFDIRQT